MQSSIFTGYINYASKATLSILMAFMLLFSTTVPKTEVKAKTVNPPFDLNCTINGDPKTRMGVDWYTNPGSHTSVLQVLAGAPKTPADFATGVLTFKDNAKYLSKINYSSVTIKLSFVRHKATATGLTAATTYSYRVGNATDGWSAIGTFATAPADNSSFQFIYAADTQASNYMYFDISSNTLINASKKVPKARFSLITGDLIDSLSGLEWEMNEWLTTMNAVWSKMPIVPVLGNHDNTRSQNFANHFNTAPLPSTIKTAMPGTVYSYEYGDALFFVLNSEVFSSTSDLNAMSSWMKKVAGASTKKWRIVAMHRGLYTGSAGYQADSTSKLLRKKLAPVFDSLHIDLVLQGHSHVYEVMGPVNAGKLVSGAVSGPKSAQIYNTTGGTVYFLNNTAGGKFYKPLTHAQMDANKAATGVSNYFSLFTGKLAQPRLQVFTCVTVASDSIKLNSYLVNYKTKALASQKPWDTFKIVK